jgi:hypothetical protein
MFTGTCKKARHIGTGVEFDQDMALGVTRAPVRLAELPPAMSRRLVHRRGINAGNGQCQDERSQQGRRYMLD